jgi:hypothetical protein
MDGVGGPKGDSAGIAARSSGHGSVSNLAVALKGEGPVSQLTLVAGTRPQSGPLNANLTATLTRLLNVGWRPLTRVTATPGGAHAGRFSRRYAPLSRPRPSPGVTSGLPLGHRCASGLTTLPASADRALDQVR